MMKITAINQMPADELQDALIKCCGSRAWVNKMLHARPFASVDEMQIKASELWFGLSEADFLEAFGHHLKIGAKTGGKTDSVASLEQKGVQGADEQVLQALASGNAEYEKKFGFIFLVFATGKSAAEMLEILKTRLPNSREKELKIAVGEHDKITALRLKKLMNTKKSPITTHVLDTATGVPASGLPMTLEMQDGADWKRLASGVTGDDGRGPDLLKPGELTPGTYRLTFQTGIYFKACGVEGFYPYAQVVFAVKNPDQHYHIPLLLSPYGYSTYRGS